MANNLNICQEYPQVGFMSIPMGYFHPSIIQQHFNAMDKYEIRRQKLIMLRDSKCGGVNAALAKAIDRDETYVNRLFYPTDKAGRKRLGDKLISVLIEKFNLPIGWFDIKDDQVPIVYDEETKMILNRLLNDPTFKMAVGILARMDQKSIQDLKSNGSDANVNQSKSKNNGTEHSNGTE